MVILCPIFVFSQSVEIDGKLKITVLDEDAGTDSVVVIRSGGELARRHVSSLPDNTGGWTEVLDTTSTMKRVGIGTESPEYKLDIVGTNGPRLRLFSQDGEYAGMLAKNNLHEYFIGINQSSTFGIYDNTTAAQRMIIDATGNIGIGLTSPTEKLDVNGNLKVAGIISGVSDPINAQDAATKAYVDAIKASFNEDLLDAGLNGFVADIDGNKYKTIKIGTQVWMAENLKTITYNDGTSIPEVTGGTEWVSLTTPAYCWYENNSPIYSELYGALYNYFTVADTNSLNVCPIGWDVPTEAEWIVLTDFLEDNGYGYGGSGDELGKTTASTFGWNNSGVLAAVGNDQGSNNSIGFTGLPGGYRHFNIGNFIEITLSGSWWSSTEHLSTTSAFNHFLYFASTLLDFSDDEKGSGFSVRCLRDD